MNHRGVPIEDIDDQIDSKASTSAIISSWIRRFRVVFCQVAEIALVASFPAAAYELVGFQSMRGAEPCIHRSNKVYMDHHDGSSSKEKQCLYCYLT